MIQLEPLAIAGNTHLSRGQTRDHLRMRARYRKNETSQIDRESVTRSVMKV